MGNNLNLVAMFGLPKNITCPRCKTVQDSQFNDYDIDCGDPNTAPGEWKLDCYCIECEHNWQHKFKVAFDGEKYEDGDKLKGGKNGNTKTN